MKTLAIVSQKGGTGKSLLAAHLAVSFERSGIATAVIDLDPQGSLASFGDKRGDAPPTVVAGLVERLPRMMDTARDGGIVLLIIDTPPHSDKNALGAIVAADLILVPVRPQAFDLRSISDTVNVLKLANRLGSAVAVINQVPPRGEGRAKEAEEFCGAYGLAVLPIRITARAAFGDALIEHKGIAEYEPGGKASAEIEALRDALARRLDLRK
jgi:chromosome partitioning protein